MRISTVVGKQSTNARIETQMGDGLREECANNTWLNIVRDKDWLELDPQADRMSEAEVALRLADFILSLPHLGAMASVAIGGASIKVGDAIVFDIGRFMAWTGWEPIREP